MPSNYLILCCPLLLLPSILPRIRVFFFPMSLLFASGSQSVWASPSASVLPVNIQASLVAWLVMNLPAAQGSIPHQEGPLKKGMATHFSILTQRLPWTEEPGRLQCMGSQGVRHDWATNTLCNWFVLKSGNPWYDGSKPSEWASPLFLPMFILLLEDSGLSVDTVKACELNGFSISLGKLAVALPNVRTGGLHSKKPIPILRVWSSSYKLSPSLQKIPFSFVLSWRENPACKSFLAPHRLLRVECLAWLENVEERTEYLAQQTLLFHLQWSMEQKWLPCTFRRGVSYQKASAVPQPMGEFCHMKVLPWSLRQAGHSANQKTKPIFGTHLNHIPTLSGVLTSFSKYFSLSLPASKFMQRVKKKKKRKTYTLIPQISPIGTFVWVLLGLEFCICFILPGFIFTFVFWSIQYQNNSSHRGEEILHWEAAASRNLRGRQTLQLLPNSLLFSRSVVSNSLWPHGLWPTRLHSPWDSPGKNTGAGCHFLLPGIFPIQGLNPGLLSISCIATRFFYHWATWYQAKVFLS